MRRDPGLTAGQYRHNAIMDVFDADLASEWEQARGEPAILDLENTEALALRAIGLDARAAPAGQPRPRDPFGVPVKSWRRRIVEFLTGE